MTQFTLYLGTKNLCPWSLRAWLMLLQTGADFEAVFISLNNPDSKEKIAKISPSKMVPVLKYDNQVIWDSLAIGECLAELFPEAHLWPKDIHTRAFARSIVCEVHSGLKMFKTYLPLNVEEPVESSIADVTFKDIQRVIEIWEDCRRQHKHMGPFLFGRFTIADAMFAPIASSFLTYNVVLPSSSEEYVHKIMELPEMMMWCNEI